MFGAPTCLMELFSWQLVSDEIAEQQRQIKTYIYLQRQDRTIPEQRLAFIHYYCDKISSTTMQIDRFEKCYDINRMLVFNIKLRVRIVDYFECKNSSTFKKNMLNHSLSL